MSNRAVFTLQDAYGRITARSFEANGPGIGDTEIQALATAYQALTKLEIIKVAFTRNVAFGGNPPVAGSSVGSGASLRARKTDAGTYTFKLTEPLDALVNMDGTLDIANAAFATFASIFDDGLGVVGIPGDFFISDGEQLDEDTPLLGGQLDK